MKDMIRTILALTAGAIIIATIAFMMRGCHLTQEAFFAPREEAVRRDVFEQSKAYNQGMIQELQDMQFQYEQADDSHKAALASIILHRAADYDTDRLPPDLRRFVENLKHQGDLK